MITMAIVKRGALVVLALVLALSGSNAAEPVRVEGGGGIDARGSSTRSYRAGGTIDTRDKPAPAPTRIQYQRPYDGRESDLTIVRPPRRPPLDHGDWGDYPFWRSYYPGIPYPVYIVDDHRDDRPDRPAQTDYQVVEPVPQVWVPGHYESVPMRDILEGQTVEVYQPAVYQQLDDGSLELVEPERTIRQPKIRIVLTKVWIEGHYEAAPLQEDPAGDPIR